MYFTDKNNSPIKTLTFDDTRSGRTEAFANNHKPLTWLAFCLHHLVCKSGGDLLEITQFKNCDLDKLFNYIRSDSYMIASFKVKKVRKQIWKSSFLKISTLITVLFFWQVLSIFLILLSPKAKQTLPVQTSWNFVSIWNVELKTSCPLNPPFSLLVHNFYSRMVFRTTNKTKTEVNNRP